MFWRFGDGTRGSLAVGVAKAAGATVLLSLILAHWLSSTVSNQEDKDKLRRLAASVSRNKADPLTTGSVTKRAEAVKLDPCTGEHRRN